MEMSRASVLKLRKQVEARHREDELAVRKHLKACSAWSHAGNSLTCSDVPSLVRQVFVGGLPDKADEREAVHYMGLLQSCVRLNFRRDLTSS